MVEQSDYIIGGEGVSYVAFYDENKKIYTSIIFEARHIFRGDAEIQLGTIEIIVEGGTIGNDDQEDRHERGFGLKNPTILFCKKSDFNVPSKNSNNNLTNNKFALKLSFQGYSFFVYSNSSTNPNLLSGLCGLKIKDNTVLNNYLSSFDNIKLPEKFVNLLPPVRLKRITQHKKESAANQQEGENYLKNKH